MNIFTSILSFSLYILVLFGILAVLPTSAQMPLPDGIHDAILFVVNAVAPWGYVIDFYSLTACVIFAAAFEFLIFSAEACIWIYKHIFKAVP